ncbi:MAG: class I SAM-dependent methyltransferase [Planctomycetes bacterium]|nr:class I SAM-dependent methyltransferase [Planctomycetota bacterium]
MGTVDFGPSAPDYATHRRGFPPSFFARLSALGLVPAGCRALDLGTGTGSLARGLAALGARAIGLDCSVAMLRGADGLPVVAAAAERVPLRHAAFDLVTAGQCWHWFDGPRAARECRRLLRPGGTLVVAHFDYLSRESEAAALTEELVLRHNPRWTMAGTDGRHGGWAPQLESAGFGPAGIFEYVEEVPYSQEAWRGRIRTCNGVLALRDAARIAEFDRELAALLRDRFGGADLSVPHRVFAVAAQRGGNTP